VDRSSWQVAGRVGTAAERLADVADELPYVVVGDLVKGHAANTEL
jgi:hypothetical protein